MKDLNDLLPPNSGWVLTEANGINDAGQIIGTGIGPDGQQRGFLMEPIPFPCEDANNNGLCDSGEKDITLELMNGGFQTRQSIVIPPGVVGLSNNKGFNLVAGKNIIINSDLTGLTPATYIQLQAGGFIHIGTGVAVKSSELIYMGAGGDIVLGPGSSFFSGRYYVIVYAWAGKIQVEDGATISGGQYLYLYGKEVAVAGAHLKSDLIYAVALGTGDMAIKDSTLQGGWMAYIYSQGRLIDFRNNRVEMSGYNGKGEAYVYLWAIGADSTLDMTGTEFTNAYVTKKANHVIQ
jgi:hypothetical protein